MITFIAPCYNEYNNVGGFISSLLCQTNPNWKCIVYQNGKNNNIKKLVNSYKDDRIIYKETKENNGFWGCHNRIDALMNIVDTELVIQTSIQDYYIPTMVEEILALYDIVKFDIAYFDCIHNHFNYAILETELALSQIDWGSFVINTEFAKSVGINHPEEFTADGMFIMDCLSKKPELIYAKLHKVMTVHN